MPARQADSCACQPGGQPCQPGKQTAVPARQADRQPCQQGRNTALPARQADSCSCQLGKQPCQPGRQTAVPDVFVARQADSCARQMVALPYPQAVLFLLRPGSYAKPCRPGCAKPWRSGCGLAGRRALALQPPSYLGKGLAVRTVVNQGVCAGHVWSAERCGWRASGEPASCCTRTDSVQGWELAEPCRWLLRPQCAGRSLCVQISYKELVTAMKAASKGGVGMELAERLEVNMVLTRMALFMIMKVRGTFGGSHCAGARLQGCAKRGFADFLL